MAMPKKGNYRLVNKYRRVNKMVEKVQSPMPNQEASMAKLSRAKCFDSLDCTPRRLANAASIRGSRAFHDLHSHGVIYPPLRVPQGVLNATSYFHATMTELLDSLNCLVWMDVIYQGKDTDDLLRTLDLVLESLKKEELYAAAHKCTCFDTSIQTSRMFFSIRSPYARVRDQRSFEY